jgi:hypothetical protein
MRPEKLGKLEKNLLFIGLRQVLLIIFIYATRTMP